MRQLGLVLITVCAILMCFAPEPAEAQLAPMGGNYAARASDTGSTGGIIDSGGGYHTSVPLEFPAARHGMPVPVSLQYTGRSMGAGGVGWGVPLTYIRRESTLSRQRPAVDPSNPHGDPRVPVTAVAPERVYVVLNGQRLDLVPKGNGVWVPRYSAAQLELHDLGDVWLMYDGEGRTYRFSDLVMGPSWPSGVPMPLLQGKNLFLLEEIDDSFNGHAEVVTLVEESPSGGLSMELLRVRYNSDPVSVHCYKNQVVLRYNIAADPKLGEPPYSVTMMGEFAWVRARVLTNVEVYSHEADATCDDVQAPAPGYVQLRNYELQQNPRDPDTLRPQLAAVVLHGQEGTAEASQSIPIATYAYGAAADGGDEHGNDNTLHYNVVGGNDLSFNFTGDSFASVTEADNGFLPAGADAAVSTGYVTWKNFIDMNGDGRPDMVYRQGNQLMVALNMPATDGFFDLSFVEPLSDGVLPLGPLEVRSASGPASGSRDSDQVWQQVIDWNGDGRLDIVRANEMPGKWVVYLNRPSGTLEARTGFHWDRREVDITAALAHLQSVGLALGPRGGGWGGYLPLANRVTGISQAIVVCKRWDESDPFNPHWVDAPEFVGTAECLFTVPILPNPAPPQGELTFTEWELQDINGDGYPDLVYSQPTKTVRASAKVIDVLHEHDSMCPFPTSLTPDDPTVRGFVGAVAECQASTTFELDTSHEQGVFAMLNTFGMLMPESSSEVPIFSLPVNWTSSIAGSTGFGVGLWVSPLDGTESMQYGGIVDVNGDGLPDYVAGQMVNLNSGVGEGGVTNVTLELPGFLTEQVNDRASACAGHNEYQSETVAALRDINGDGIPDYISLEGNEAQVVMGTSGGFEEPGINPVRQHRIDSGSMPFALSVETESCGTDSGVGKTSRTFQGLYDLDGDGKPEVLDVFASSRLVLEGGSPSFTPGAPEAGLLTSVGNGHGATTEIKYRSAKEDGSQFFPHSVPFPELVVKSVQIKGQPGAGHDLVPTFYAYGGISMYYDNVVEQFLSTGYERTIEVHPKTGNEGTAIITDHYVPFDLILDATPAVLFQRLAQTGHVQEVNVLVGAMDTTNPWGLFSVFSPILDPRRTINVHHDIAVKLTTESFDGAKSCIDLPKPFDLDESRTLNGNFNACETHGLVYDSVVTSTEDTAPSTPGNGVGKRTEVTVDDFGRATDVRSSGDDVNQRNEDLCVHTDYASPAPLPGGSQARVLSAVSQRTVSDCNGVALARQTFSYDTQSNGSVLAGFLSSAVQSRLDEDGQTVGADVGLAASATQDGLGNPDTITRQRIDRHSDGSQTVVTKRVQTTYDEFGLVPTEVKTSGTDVVDRTVHVHYDDPKLLPDRVTDPNGAVTGTTYDGFGRPRLQLVQPAGGTLGAMSCTEYLGFAQGDSGPQQVRVTEFVDAVDPQAACGTAGRTATTTLDELGRSTGTAVNLGSDYAEGLIAGAALYDDQGRVAFMPDPLPSSQDAKTAYGTTYTYNTDGTPACTIRGNGPQPPNATTNLGTEVMATCYDRHFEHGREILTATDPAGKQRRIERSAIGRALTEMTLGPSAGGSQILERADLGYDRLGHQSSITRYREPAGASEPVTWTMHTDSLGAMHELDEPGSAPRLREYDDWGELIEEHWNDGVEHALFTTYDALGRPLHREERTGASLVADSVYDSVYDVPVSSPLDISQDNVMGRLVEASSSSGSTFYSYDGLGRLAGKSYTSTDPDLAGAVLDEKNELHDDGSPKALHFHLPDNGNADERIEYASDSAGRLKSVTSAGGFRGLIPEPLFQATVIDVLGRIRQAQYGSSMAYTAHYADVGRRLMDDVTVSAPPLLSREIHYGTFDVLGRETQRDEHVGSQVKSTASTYDALGRLAGSQGTTDGVARSSPVFGYDPLGNRLSQSDPLTQGANDIALSFGDASATPDLDRICRIEYGRTTLQGSDCNVVYDRVGNIVTEPTRNGARHLTYFADGLVRTLSDENGNSAQFRYDASGMVSALDVQSGDSSLERRDRRFGSLIEKRDVVDNGPIIIDSCPGCDPPPPPTGSMIIRRIPGPGGLFVSRRGAGGPWVFAFGEPRGNRFFTDDTGAVVQEDDYRPFGEGAPIGSAERGTTLYSREQWNGGDALEAFELVHLGARLYDPALGRFLSRDPLMAGHPYAFVDNDPVNLSDPTGLQSCGDEGNPCPLPIPNPFGGGSGSGSGSSGGGAPKSPLPRPRILADTSPSPPPWRPGDQDLYDAYVWRWRSWERETQECENPNGLEICFRFAANILVYTNRTYMRIVTFSESVERSERVVVPGSRVVHPYSKDLPQDQQKSVWLPLRLLRVTPPEESHWYDDPLGIDRFRDRWGLNPKATSIEELHLSATEEVSSSLKNSEHIVTFEGFVPIPVPKRAPAPRPRSIVPKEVGQPQWGVPWGDASDVEAWRYPDDVEMILGR